MKKIILLLVLIFPICIKAITTSARSVILMDMDSDRILYEKNINEVRSVASISKIMTAIIAIESEIIWIRNLFKCWRKIKIRRFSIWINA